MVSPVKAGSADSLPADAAPSSWRKRQRLAARLAASSLSEVFGTIRTLPTGSTWRKLLAFLGPGYLVAVGYMDPATGRPPSPAARHRLRVALHRAPLQHHGDHLAGLSRGLASRPGAIWRKLAATPFRAGSHTRSGRSPSLPSVPPTSPR